MAACFFLRNPLLFLSEYDIVLLVATNVCAEGTNMTKEKMFYIVEESALPTVMLKVVEAKRLLESGREKTTQGAAATVGISRSALYKYKDLIFPFYENTRGKTVTLAMGLENVPGLLSRVLNVVAESGANILTINQNIPLNNLANVTITIEMSANPVGELVKILEATDGIRALKIIARE